MAALAHDVHPARAQFELLSTEVELELFRVGGHQPIESLLQSGKGRTAIGQIAERAVRRVAVEVILPAPRLADGIDLTKRVAFLEEVAVELLQLSVRKRLKLDERRKGQHVLI